MTANKRDLFCATLSCYAVYIGSAHEPARLFYSTCHLPPAFIDSLLCSLAGSHFNTKRQVKNIVKSAPFSMSAFIIQLPVRSPTSDEALKRLGSGQKSGPRLGELAGRSRAPPTLPYASRRPCPRHRPPKPSLITTVGNFCYISKGTPCRFPKGGACIPCMLTF